MSEVADLLAALRDGALDLETVARRFRERSWPAPPFGDPVTTVPGSFEEVVLAYARGDLTDVQYTALLYAAVSAAGGP